jgi:hypothetical protein
MARQRQRPAAATVTAKEDLIASLGAHRRDLSSATGALGGSLNPSLRVQRSFQRHSSRWIAWSAVAGFVGTRMWLASRRRDAARRERGEEKGSRFGVLALLGFILRTALTVSRPAAAKLLQKRVVQMIDSP